MEWTHWRLRRESQVPGNASARGHRSKLVNDIARNEIDIVVMETKVSIADALSPELVQFCFFHPLSTLGGRGRGRGRERKGEGEEEGVQCRQSFPTPGAFTLCCLRNNGHL